MRSEDPEFADMYDIYEGHGSGKNRVPLKDLLNNVFWSASAENKSALLKYAGGPHWMHIDKDGQCVSNNMIVHLKDGRSIMIRPISDGFQYTVFAGEKPVLTCEYGNSKWSVADAVMAAAGIFMFSAKDIERAGNEQECRQYSAWIQEEIERFAKEGKQGNGKDS